MAERRSPSRGATVDEAVPAAGSPEWLRGAIAGVLRELGQFFVTARRFTLNPYRAALAWAEGAAESVNPLAFLATSAAVVQPVRGLVQSHYYHGGDSSLLAQLLSALGPFAHFALVGFLCHVFFRLTGSRRRATDAIGLALFAGGGPAALAEVLFWASVPLTRALGLGTGALVVGLALAFSVFCVAFASALAALYRVGALRIFLAFGFAFVITGILFGILDPPGYYGMHWVVTFGTGRFPVGVAF